MVDNWKFVSHVEVFTPFGTLLRSDCVPICTDITDAYYYPVWKVVQRLRRTFDCSLFTYKVKVSMLSKTRENSFSVSFIHTFSYADVQPKFKLYE